MHRLDWSRRDGGRAIVFGVVGAVVVFALALYSSYYLDYLPAPVGVVTVVLVVAGLLSVMLALVGLYALTGRLHRKRERVASESGLR